MSKERKNSIVPKLRFPEFKDIGDWEEKSIQQLIDEKIIIGHLDGNHGALYPRSEEFSKDGIPYISANDFITGGIDFGKCKYLPEQRAMHFKKGVAKDGDILFAHNATVGPVTKLKTDYPFVVLSTTATYFRCNNNNLLNDFLKFALSTPNFVSQYSRVMSQSTRNQVPITTQRKFNLQLPLFGEQQKIADCLSSLDDLITAENQKLEALKVHKKGLMQQLFPAEGETLPKVRFEEFSECGEWEDFQLEDAISYFKGFAFESKNYTSTGRRIIRVSDMGFDYIKKPDNAIFINEENANQYDRWKLKEGDLIVTTVGSKPPMYDSLVGRTIVVKTTDEGSLLNQNAVCLRANEKIRQSFLNVLFKRDEYITFIESIIRGNANQGSITLENLFQLKLLVPSQKEQQKIADCLSSLDEFITTQIEKIEQLKEHKKGLMQGLFPNTKTNN